MFVQSDGQQPTSSAWVLEDIQESQQSATDTNLNNTRPPLYMRWNPDFGSLEVVRGFRDTSTPEGKYYTRTWTEAPPEQHRVTYEGTRYGRRLQTMVHNPRTGLFELKHSPIQSPTAGSIRRLRGTAYATSQYPSLSGTATQNAQPTSKSHENTQVKSHKITVVINSLNILSNLFFYPNHSCKF